MFRGAAWPARIGIGLGLFHLVVVASGNFPSWPGRSPFWRAVRDGYQGLTGAGGGFGFFSPGVGNELDIRFLVEGREYALDRLVNQEVALRIGNMYRLFGYSYANEKVKRSVAASLATGVFRRFPQASEATLVASLYRLPSLAEWARGQRPSTKEMYRVTFRMKSREVRAE